jgi:hypothetical protein
MVGPRARNPLRSNLPTRGQATAVGSASNHANSKPVAKMVQIRCGFIDSAPLISWERPQLAPASGEAGALGGDELADGAKRAGEGRSDGALRLAEAAEQEETPRQGKGCRVFKAVSIYRLFCLLARAEKSSWPPPFGKGRTCLR